MTLFSLLIIDKTAFMIECSQLECIFCIQSNYFGSELRNILTDTLVVCLIIGQQTTCPNPLAMYLQTMCSIRQLTRINVQNLLIHLSSSNTYIDHYTLPSCLDKTSTSNVT